MADDRDDNAIHGAALHSASSVRAVVAAPWLQKATTAATRKRVVMTEDKLTSAPQPQQHSISQSACKDTNSRPKRRVGEMVAGAAQQQHPPPPPPSPRSACLQMRQEGGFIHNAFDLACRLLLSLSGRCAYLALSRYFVVFFPLSFSLFLSFTPLIGSVTCASPV